MLQNNIELDLKTKLIESGTTQTEVAEKVGVSLAYVNRITKGREQIVNKTFVKMMDELGYDVELTYKKKQPIEVAAIGIWRCRLTFDFLQHQKQEKK